MLFFLLICVALFAAWLVYFDSDFYTFFLALLPQTKEKIASFFDGKTVWICGASSGIGEELAVQIAPLGAKVIISARRKDELERVAEKCKEVCKAQGKTAKVFVLPFDVVKIEEHSSVVEAAKKAFQQENGGKNQIDILYLNAGRSQRGTAEETPLSQTEEILRLNVISQISLCKEALPVLLGRENNEKKEASIILTSSVAGKIPSPLISSYCLSKHAVYGYFEALRTELNDEGLSVVLVAPGPVQTAIGDNVFYPPGSERKAEHKETKMPVSRCVFLMLTATVYGLYDCWISRNPILLFLYWAQYFPTFLRFAWAKLGGKRVRGFKNGVDAYDFKGMLFGKSKTE